MYKLTRFLLIAGMGLVAYALGVLSMMLAPWSFLFLFVGGVVLIIRQRQSVLSAFGTAAWASARELRNAGMLGAEEGLILGRNAEDVKGWLPAIKGLFDRRIPHKDACLAFMAEALRRWKYKAKAPLVRLPHAVHTAIFAPTGVGKGVSFVVPQLLSCPDSTVVVDFKGELAQITAEHRRKVFGHRIILLDPFRVVTQTPDSFNPLDFIDRENPQALDECRDLAESQVIRTGQEKDPHWADVAEVWIAALVAATVHYGAEGDRSLQTVRKLLCDPAKIEAIIKLLSGSDAWQGMLARLGNQLSNFKDKELASTLTTTNRFLRYLDTLAVAESTSSSTFSPNTLRYGKLTVYLILPPDHLRAQSALLRMWISSMLRAVVRGGLSESKVQFILDEAASLGHMDALDDAVDKYRGYGVRLQFYYQSLGQLKKCFPEGQEQTLLSNVSQVFFGVNELQTAEYVSNRLGEETIVVRSGGTSSGTSRSWQETGSQGSSGRNAGSNDNWQQHARKLLKPEEVIALSPRTAITFTPGVRPVWTHLLRYYEEKRASFVSVAISELRVLAFGVGFLIYAIVLMVLTFAMKHLVEERNEQSRTGVFPVNQGGNGGGNGGAGNGGQGWNAGGNGWPDLQQNPERFGS
jgi:type IV secretion system protein VirD4